MVFILIAESLKYVAKCIYLLNNRENDAFLVCTILSKICTILSN